jgi:hypothetical protein
VAHDGHDVGVGAQAAAQPVGQLAHGQLGGRGVVVVEVGGQLAVGHGTAGLAGQARQQPELQGAELDLAVAQVDAAGEGGPGAGARRRRPGPGAGPGRGRPWPWPTGG